MKNNMDKISMTIKECIAAYASIETTNGNPVGYFLSFNDIDRIATDVVNALNNMRQEVEK